MSSRLGSLEKNFTSNLGRQASRTLTKRARPSDKPTHSIGPQARGPQNRALSRRKKAQKEIERLTKIPTPRNKKSDPKICDLMMTNYLKHPFFQRFKYIIVSTISTELEDNYQQYSSRKIQQGSTAHFEDADKQASEQKAHAAMYTAWRNNLNLLKPEKEFITTINSHGDLISNKQCICTQWKHKVGLA